MPNIGPLELIIVLAIVLLIFGPKRLPGLGRQLGRGMREFKDSVTGKDHDEEQRDALPAAPADPVPGDPVRAADPVDEQPAARAFGERRED
jgi:sec-independent protein translocase protein TatA